MDQNFIDSCNSTPFVSAPSSPNRETTPQLTAFYHSAPSSPMHFLLSTTASLNSNPNPSSTSFDTLFEFDLPSTSVASADELFFNGQIRRRTRSFDLRQNEQQRQIVNATQNDEERSNETTPRSSSAGRNSSKKWIFLKEFLSRSKSEGRNNQDRHKKLPQPLVTTTTKKCKDKAGEVKKKTVNNNNKNLPSAHELHYTTKRAQAEEMRKRTFLPYRQGLLSCLSFGSKGYGAMNGFARALNPVSSTSLST